MRKKGDVFWGVVLVLGAVMILLSRFGYLEGIGIWKILCNVYLAAILVRGIFKGSFGQILFSAALLVIVNDEFLHLEAITPWPVLGAALLGTIGLKLLFPNFGRRTRAHRLIKSGKEGRWGGSGEWISYDNAFSSSVKYVTVEIAQVTLDNAFGTTQVYFTDARLKDGSAHVEVDTAFGNVVLYVPSDWTVVTNTENVCAKTTEKGRNIPSGANILYVNGDVAFGGLEIIYV